jgi:hypothetical protein
MAARSRWHPDHVFPLFCSCACLRRWHRFQVEIQLRGLIRLGFRIHDGRLHCAVHDQRNPLHARCQPIGNVATVSIRLNGFKQLAAVPRFDSNIGAFYRLPFRIHLPSGNQKRLWRDPRDGSNRRNNQPCVRQATLALEPS